MPLNSHLFRRVRPLEACLLHDSAHLTKGTKGDHVRLIQRALVWMGDRHIPAREYITGVYGPGTAAAVLKYKRERHIVNFGYQTQPDDIVGKMTIASLDRDVAIKERVGSDRR